MKIDGKGVERYERTRGELPHKPLQVAYKAGGLVSRKPLDPDDPYISGLLMVTFL